MAVDSGEAVGFYLIWGCVCWLGSFISVSVLAVWEVLGPIALCVCRLPCREVPEGPAAGGKLISIPSVCVHTRTATCYDVQFLTSLSPVVLTFGE